MTDVSHLTTPTPCSEEPVPGRVDKDGTDGASAKQSESEFFSSNDGASEKEKDEKCLAAATDGEHLSPGTGGGEQAATTSVAGTSQETDNAEAESEISKTEGEGISETPPEKEKDEKCLTAGTDGKHLSPDMGGGEQTAITSAVETGQSQETDNAEAESEISKTEGEGISETPSEKEKDEKCLTAGTDGKHLSPDMGGGEQTAITSAAETGQSQETDNAEAETRKTEGEGVNDTPSEKEKDEKYLTAATDGEHPSPVAGGGEQTVTTSIAKTGQSQETDKTEAETSEREGGGADDTPGDSVADAPESSRGSETNKNTVDKGGEGCAADNRQSQPSDQADTAFGDKGRAKLPERLPVPETKPDENQVTAETPSKDSSVNVDTNRTPDPPGTPSQGTEASPQLAQATSTADPEPSSSNSSTTSLETGDASLKVQNDDASSQVGDPASPKGKELTKHEHIN